MKVSYLPARVAPAGRQVAAVEIGVQSPHPQIDAPPTGHQDETFLSAATLPGGTV